MGNTESFVRKGLKVGGISGGAGELTYPQRQQHSLRNPELRNRSLVYLAKTGYILTGHITS